MNYPLSVVETLAEAISLLREMVDPDDCQYDHHGYCQTHGWTADTPCPHSRAKILLAASDAATHERARP